jgi:hypothetical protein
MLEGKGPLTAKEVRRDSEGTLFDLVLGARFRVQVQIFPWHRLKSHTASQGDKYAQSTDEGIVMYGRS